MSLVLLRDPFQQVNVRDDAEGLKEFSGDELFSLFPISQTCYFAQAEQTRRGMYYTYRINVNRDFRKAFECFKRAAYVGLEEAFYCERGEELPAKLGYAGIPEARYALARCFEQGLGVLPNQEKASRCYRETVQLVRNKNDRRHRYLLGLCYQREVKNFQDITRALQCFDQAASEGGSDIGWKDQILKRAAEEHANYLRDATVQKLLLDLIVQKK